MADQHPGASGVDEPPSAPAEAGGASQETAAAPPLPMEILTELLARLPAKSAGRFRTVSREWCGTLSSPYFVDLHLRRANRPDRPRLLLTPVGSNDDGYLYSWQRGGGEVEKLMADEFPKGMPVAITKPCRGLILIRCTDNGGYYVCNPSTGAFLELPDSEVPWKTIWRPSIRGQNEVPYFSEVSYGFGYCPVRKEHKVVRLFCHLDNGAWTAACEVFVVDSPAWWRPSAKKPPSCAVEETKPAVFVNGHLYFLCRDGGITSFNISDESFGSMPPPPDFMNASPILTELDQCLCVCYGEPYSDDPFHVCLLRDQKKARWEKLCVLDRTAWPESERTLLQSEWIAPLCMQYSDDGQKKIMFGTGACKVFEVGTDGGAPNILLTPDKTILGSCDDDNIPSLCLYEESLVPVGRTIEQMVFSSPTTEAWSDILKWLPTRTVLELSLVCREWRAMIMTDRFIQSHVIHANLNKSPRIMLIVDPRFGWYMDLQDFIDANGPAMFSNLSCSQPCHGLNVGSCAFWDFVCNPAVGYCEHIQFDDNDGTFFTGRIGLGYDSEVNKHVLVHITYKEKNLETREYELQCKVKYVKEQEWRPIDPPSRPVADMPPTYANGKIYWMVDPGLGPISLTCEIVAFSIEMDEFEVLQGPPCNHNSGHMSIVQLQGALCVVCSDQNMNVIDIWMMKDIGSWFMEYRIDFTEFPAEYSSEATTPLAVDPKDGRILLSTGCSLGYYDPNTAALEIIYSVGMPGHEYKFCPIISHESLVCPLRGF